MANCNRNVMRVSGLSVPSRLMLLLALATQATGCCKTTATAETVCSVWRPITWSVNDTPETIAEIKAHNARRNAWCEGVVPEPAPR